MAGIKFPFGKGAATFPAVNENKVDEIVDNVQSLLSIGEFELPMGEGIGVNIRSLVFLNMTKIEMVILAQAIRNTIIDNEPRMKVSNVEVTQEDVTVTIEISYDVLGTTGSLTMEMEASAAA